MSHKVLHPANGKDINRTYVISASEYVRSPLNLKLQRRETMVKSSPLVKQPGQDKDISQRDEPEKRLTLQRRPRTGSIEKDDAEKNVKSIDTAKPTQAIPTNNGSSGQTPRSNKLINVNAKPKSLLIGHKTGNPQMNGSTDYLKFQSLKNPKGNGTDKKLRGSDQDATKTLSTKKVSLGNQRTPRSETPCLMRSASTREIKSPAVTPKRPVGTLPAVHRKLSSVDGLTEKTREFSFPCEVLQEKNETSSHPSTLEDCHKVENCAVTVAVRVRPFSTRETNENATQVVFMSGQETMVQHPDSKHNHSFLYDFSFSSFQKNEPNYASQEKVYEKLAAPLLDWSLLGYNTCLFAYGQTGSGKSYTMMGFGEEPGIIPRFCEHLFSKIQTTKQKLSFHLEMSYFEVYNEKIHDLLVFKADNGQKKQPLRVREHPLLGPYVEDLSTNVASSFQDVQGWLELGNKQRATAATGMNDKSSRSHSVFTLIMTQTKTEIVDGEEHDHRVTSRINLVDLAGSERCASAKTTGERLKEGVSINKSLLTLGKVISALSENSHLKKEIFIPYRESVLTWLLKDSLGGNSKTAMIATVSPAIGNVEETLSTLRYAKQARLIINVAKVNEDMNAKLIRELKTEIEKLKASQLSARNKDSAKYLYCQHEITSLKLKLSQQEKEMSELHRAWREKLEQAEQRKKEETKELQKAGITFKMDNRLPNLVNLNEDPQLSEMLLYMIKEGKTTVGKYQPGSCHDIQLSGALIAEDHCIITNIHNIVTITPTVNAKTYVNGNQISASTVLHHGDRVILGGDHYFRFNHPVEVQQLKGGPSRISAFSSECPKDFEFAKNELLHAQRSRLEEEIEEARLRAKEEMIHEIQIAKEMAQQELSSQKFAYEDRIRALEAVLEAETLKKQQQEISSKKAVSKIQELEEAKMQLQHEVQLNKRRLEMETFATRQALEDHTIRHAKILQALEMEKQKIAMEVEMLQQEKHNRERHTSVQPSWNALKLSVMIQEANTISAKLRKHTTFSRHDMLEKDKENQPGGSVQLLVRNLNLGIVTFWSLEKFDYKLAAMKELYESNGAVKDDGIFYDPGDEWEPDLSKSSVSNFSRRRSKSFMKNKRISGCLQEIQVHPIQNYQTGHTSGLMNNSSSFLSNSSSVCSSPIDSHLPEICKDLIGSSLDYLGQRHANEGSIADSVICCLHTVCCAVHTLSRAYEQQDDDGTDALFLVNRAAQFQSVRMTSAFQQLVVFSKHWLDHLPENQGSSRQADSLVLSIRKLGGYLQLLLQGCCSDISPMVNEAKDKANRTTEQILQNIGNLAALNGTELHFLEEESTAEHGLQKSISEILYIGLRFGIECLIDSGVQASCMLQTDLERFSVYDKILEDIKKNSKRLSSFIQNSLASFKKLNLDLLMKDISFSVRSSLSTGLCHIKNSMDLLRNNVVSLLRGSDIDASEVLACLNDINSSSSQVNKSLSVQVIGLPELQTLLQALSCAIHKRYRDGPSRKAFKVQSLEATSHGVFSPSTIQWV